MLLVKSGHAKIWSNGIDLEWLLAEVARDPKRALGFLSFSQFLRRLLTYPLITIAAINGHAFAGGAIMACAFDFRFMRSDRGYFAFRKWTSRSPLCRAWTPSLRKPSPPPWSWSAVDRKRYTATELEDHRVVLKACPGKRPDE